MPFPETAERCEIHLGKWTTTLITSYEKEKKKEEIVRQSFTVTTDNNQGQSH